MNRDDDARGQNTIESLRLALEAAEERCRQNSHDLSILSDAAMGFLTLGSDDDIYDYIGECVTRIVGTKEVIVITEYDDSTDILSVRKVLGLGRWLQPIIGLLEKHPEQVAIPLVKPYNEILSTGKLTRLELGGIHEFTGGKIPKSAARTIEKTLGLKAYYIAGFVREGRIYADLSILLRSAQQLANLPLVEAFVGLCAVALERRQVEQRKADLEVQLYHSQKLESLGRLAGGVAHDFNNMLAAITGYTDLMLHEIDDGSPLRDDLKIVKTAADRAASLTRQLLAFGRKQVLEERVVELNQVVLSLEQMIGRMVGEDVELLLELDVDLWLVKADPRQLEQVLVNLAVNARDAMPEGGTLTIKTSNITVSDNEARELGGLKPADYALLSVSDTGTGIDDEVIDKIFEPFFTTKEPGRGTGLGLSSAYGIAKQSGGTLLVKSALGEGTTFALYVRRLER